MPSLDDRVKITFVPPPPDLAPYISLIYHTEVSVEEGERIVDWLHPEWGNMRFFKGMNSDVPVFASLVDNPAHASERSIVIGPTSRSTYFSLGAMRAWGIGILPLGWTKLFHVSAEHYADRHSDMEGDPQFADFAPMYKAIFQDSESDALIEAARIVAFLRERIAQADPDDKLVVKAHAALMNREIKSVIDMADAIGVSNRSFDRLSRRVFGFPPKLLMRRQRFLRSLAISMLDPELNFAHTLDGQYFDQSHFNRDFRRFMGMAPGKYRALAHPILKASVEGRMRAMGAPMQVLHDPARKNGSP